MATIQVRNPVAQYVNGGKPPLILPFKIASSATTWVYGDVLKLSSGYAEKASAGDSAALLGIALSDCPLVTPLDTGEYLVLVFTPDLVFSMNAWADNAGGAGNVITQASIGTAYDLAISASPLPVKYVLDVGNTTDAILVVEGPTDEIGAGEIGDLYQRVNVRLKAAACAFPA